MSGSTVWPSRYEEVTGIAREIAKVVGDTTSVILATRPDPHGNVQPLPPPLVDSDPRELSETLRENRLSIERRVHQLERDVG